MQVIARRYLKLENANATRTARSDYAKFTGPEVQTEGREDGTLSFACDPLHKNKSRHTRRKGSCVGGNGKSPLPRWTTIRVAHE